MGFNNIRISIMYKQIEIIPYLHEWSTITMITDYFTSKKFFLLH